MQVFKRGAAVPVILIAGLLSSAWGIEPEKGPAYLTDSHGASGVVQAFLELSEAAPEYDKYWQGALNWLISVAQHDRQGALYWYVSTTAPKGHPSHRIGIPSMCHVIRMFFAGYRRCGDGRYRDTGLTAVRTLLERFARTRRTRLGVSYAWSHSYRPNDRSPGLLAGHSHGLGNLIDTLLDGYEAKPDDALKAELENALEGLLINLRLRATLRKQGAATLVAWPTLKNPNVVETGYCYGQAGVVLPLLRLAELRPDLKLKDGTTPRSLANGSLRYLMRAARQTRGGYVWPYMRHTRSSKNIGFGSGTAGIGWAFLRGFQVNREFDPEFATECLKYARGAAVYAVNLLSGPKVPRRLRSPGGDAGFGVCGGASGGGFLLIETAKVVGKKEPAFARRLRISIEKIGKLVIASAIRTNGTLVCPDRTHFKRVNLALDYGQTGIVLGLAVAGKYLDNDELIGAAKQVADYIVQCAVPAGGGYKFAQFHPLPQ
ncbi:MAG: hypothetical protein GXP31_02485 [Kiritimatiellaeota bacterium]|nr:hypothetical protein [Kiritimatiellota bacterium]